MKKKQLSLFGTSFIKELYKNSDNFSEFNEFNSKYYDVLKDFNGIKYSGMKVGGIHRWKYDNGIWIEKKVSPNQWQINFSCIKSRLNKAPKNSGAKKGSGFHWLILADQKAIKIDENNYDTQMYGIKFKMGHKRPDWKTWSYNYPEQKSYKQKLIEILEDILKQLKESN
ncbi:MAG: hypothetical protein ACTSRZ_02445 [Promethearchaeota archaeon]